MRVPVLIVGAGPTGLVLALSLAARGIAFRLISAAAGPGERSRATVVHARTLEFYRQLGFADAVVAAGIPVRAAHLRRRGRGGRGLEVARLDLADMGERLSAFPFVLAFPQDLHEQLLLDQLAKLGRRVEWNTRLTELTQTPDEARATLVGPAGVETVAADWVAGCDGAHSAVRHAAEIGFTGGTYDQLFYVADVRIAGPFDPDLRFTLGARLLALSMPVRKTGMQRLIGLVPPALSGRDDLTFDDVRGAVEPLLDVRVAAVNWFSTYRVHHRVADAFRRGRAFLLGDAAHIHSPVGGQGMNTGIGDAINLGWKLAEVIRGQAPAALLDSYSPERRGFARQLVATTDAAFGRIVAPGLRGEAVRRLLAPAVATALRLRAGRRTAFRALSQISIHYPDSPLSEGRAGRVRGGDRLPWTGAAEDNHAALASGDWQVHVYGDASAVLREVCGAAALPLHAFAWSDAAADAGFARDAAYLVRPDGHVALAAAAGDAAAALPAWLSAHGVPLT